MMPYDVYQCGDIYMQIMGTRGHWVLAIVHEDTVYLYDSLFSEEISPRVELRIAVVMTTSERAMEVLIVHSHQQTSSVDCGLFSIVNAMVFAMQRKILSTTFDEVAEADMDMLEVEVHCLCLLSAMNFIISNAWN